MYLSPFWTQLYQRDIGSGADLLIRFVSRWSQPAAPACVWTIPYGLQHPWEGKHRIVVFLLGNAVAPKSKTATQRFHSVFNLFIGENHGFAVRMSKGLVVAGPTKAVCSLILQHFTEMHFTTSLHCDANGFYKRADLGYYRLRALWKVEHQVWSIPQHRILFLQP